MSGAIDYDERGPRGAPTLVFLHGIGGGSDSWQPQFAAFAERYRCLAWNMPGYRGSAPCVSLTFAALAAALADWLDELGLTAPHLVGHSIGGMVAQEFVARYPNRARSLILSATSPAFGRADGAFQQRFIAERLAPLNAGRTVAELAPKIVDSLLGEGADPAGTALAERCMAQVPDATYRVTIQCLVTFDRRDQLPYIAVPTLLIAGERDRNAPPAMMATMASRIPGARYACINGAGHLANLERPRQFNLLVRDFVAHQNHGDGR